MKTIYLAGPIAGLTEGEATGWRDDFISQLPLGIVGISPLRCEPASDSGKYDVPCDSLDADPRWGTTRAIKGKNEYDVRNCDLAVAVIPSVRPGEMPTCGTIAEMGMLYMVHKPIILITDSSYFAHHPLVGGFADWTVDNVDMAVEIAVGLLAHHTKEGWRE